MFRRVIKWLVIGMSVPLGFGGCLVIWMLARFAYTLSPPGGSVTPADLVSTLLTGLTISIALLAITIGALAIWGYGAIIDQAKRIAKTEAAKAARRHLKTPDIRKQLQADIRALVADEIKKSKEGIEMPHAFSETEVEKEAQPKHVGKTYPGQGLS